MTHTQLFFNCKEYPIPLAHPVWVNPARPQFIYPSPTGLDSVFVGFTDVYPMSTQAVDKANYLVQDKSTFDDLDMTPIGCEHPDMQKRVRKVITSAPSLRIATNGLDGLCDVTVGVYIMWGLGKDKKVTYRLCNTWLNIMHNRFCIGRVVKVDAVSFFIQFR